MKCPACDAPLYEMTVTGVELDVCRTCGGIWFDQYEFKKFDEPHEFAGDEILEIEAKANRAVQYEGQRQCSRCEDQLMTRRFYSPRQQIEIDECYVCGGIWLDYGELIEIRKLFKTDEERQSYVAQEFSQEFGRELADFYQELSQETAKYNRFANMFKFLYPSWYIPGDQEWGKF